MGNYSISDIGTWINDNRDKVYRISEYKKMFTPYEVENKFMDEDVYENTYEDVSIVDAYEIPNDVLLKLLIIKDNDDEDDDFGNVYLYKRLSDVRIMEYDYDNKKGE